MSDTNVLDVGCGMQPHGSPNIRLDIYRSPFVNIVADAQHLPFRRNSINTIFCYEVLEHLENPLAALGEMRRVLKPTGKVTVSFPKPSCANVQIAHLLEYILNLPFALLSPLLLAYIVKASYLGTKMRTIYYHKWIMSPSVLKKYFTVTKIEGYYDIGLSFLGHGRKSKRIVKPYSYYACYQIQCRRD